MCKYLYFMFRSVCGAYQGRVDPATCPPATQGEVPTHSAGTKCPSYQEATEPGLLLARSIVHLGECLSNICTSLGPGQKSAYEMGPTLICSKFNSAPR